MPDSTFIKVAALADRRNRSVVDIALDQLDGHPGTYQIANDFGLSEKTWGDHVRRRDWTFTIRDKTNWYVIVPVDNGGS